MVHVTKSNFLTQLSDFLHHLPTSSFIALDLEMTGISLPGTHERRPNKIELPGERYERLLKGVPERYSILQVGVALFCENPEYKRKNGEEKAAAVGGGVEHGGSTHSSGGPGVGHNRNGAEDINEIDEHAYMHREGMLNQDELEDLTEREEEGVAENDKDEEEEAEYTSRIYNFYLFPGSGSRRGGPKEREVTLNPSTVKFLLDNHMDFDKVFREGIPFTTVNQAEYLKKKFFERYDESKREGGESAKGGQRGTPRKDRVKLTRVEDIAFVARTMAGLREWIDSDNVAVDGVAATVAGANNGNGANGENNDNDGANANNNGMNPNETNIAGQEEEGTSLVLPPCNAFLRRCLYETIEDEYPGLIFERCDVASPGDNQNNTNGVARNQIRVVRLSPAEKKQREARLRQEAWDKLLLEDIGFTTLFKAISDACNGGVFTKEQTTSFLDGLSPDLMVPAAQDASTEGKKIPLVIHNGLHDLMFLLTHCHNTSLPDTFEDTKRLIQRYFPNVYDTKVLATEYSDAIVKGWRTNLEPLFEVACHAGGEPDTNNILSHKTPSIANQDGKGQGQAHEAAWDAFMTGCVFNALCNRILESKNRLNLDLTLDGLLHDSTSSLMREWLGLNKIYMHASLYTIDLESSSGPPGLNDPLSTGLSIDTTFHISGIDTTVSTRDILQALTTGNESEEEAIRLLKYEIIWVDDTSFFVGTRLVDGIPTNDSTMTGLVASHVRNALYAGLGDVNILSLRHYFAKKYGVVEESEPAGIFGSLASVATAPFRVLGSVLGFGQKRQSEDEDNGKGSNKRRRLG